MDVAVPRASSMFIRTALASVEIIGMICWATPGSIVAVAPMLILYFYMLVSCLVCPLPLTLVSNYLDTHLLLHAGGDKSARAQTLHSVPSVFEIVFKKCHADLTSLAGISCLVCPPDRRSSNHPRMSSWSVLRGAAVVC